MSEKSVDWYNSIVALGNFEVEHGRTRFYETAKLHLAVVGGVLALSAYAVAHSNLVPFVLALTTRTKNSPPSHVRWRNCPITIEKWSCSTRSKSSPSSRQRR